MGSQAPWSQQSVNGVRDDIYCRDGWTLEAGLGETGIGGVYIYLVLAITRSISLVLSFVYSPHVSHPCNRLMREVSGLYDVGSERLI